MSMFALRLVGVDRRGSASEVEKGKREMGAAVMGSSRFRVIGMSAERPAGRDASASAEGCAGPVTVESGASVAEQQNSRKRATCEVE